MPEHGNAARSKRFAREVSACGGEGATPVIAKPGTDPYLAGVNASPNLFWQTHPGLVWSNTNATDSAHIRAALLRPRFGLLLDIAVAFGLERLQKEWAALEVEHTREVERARQPVGRILRHIQEGFTRAASRD